MALQELALIESERLETMEKLSKLQLQGLSETQIARQEGMQRKLVIQLLEEYKEILRSNPEAKQRAQDALNEYDRNVSMLIKEAWDTVSIIDDEIQSGNRSHNLISKRTELLKAIHDFDSKRVDAIQKAGIMDAADLGDELVEMERQRDAIIDILRNDLCPTCRANIGYKLSQITAKPEVVVVD